jgi:hypothetical protein
MAGPAPVPDSSRFAYTASIPAVPGRAHFVPLEELDARQKQDHPTTSEANDHRTRPRHLRRVSA